MGNFSNKYHVRYSRVNCCERCGAQFVTNKPASFCSNACRQAWYREEKKRKDEARKLQLPLFPDEDNGR